jgi:broad specificity phosphatase PhoE
MARHRLPAEKAKTAGADLVHPGRFADRKAPTKTRPIGEPYARMTDAQKECWRELVADMPWLHAAHRTLLRLACYHAARLDTDPEFGVSATQALSSILSKLGATPVDETKVNHADDGEEDPADRFFRRPN